MPLFNQLEMTNMSSSQAAGITEKSSAAFMTPWLDPASMNLPFTWTEIANFCELCWYSNGIYQQALARTSGYFVTKVVVQDVSAEEQDRWSEFGEKDFNWIKFLTDEGRNYMAYGDVKMSPRSVITRLLRCPDRKSVV